jgi:hypothetical protein
MEMWWRLDCAVMVVGVDMVWRWVILWCLL